MMKLTTSDNGRKFIEGWEGLVLTATDDGFGNPTIGYGHTTPAGPPHVTVGDTITKDQADTILARDLHNVEYEINTWCVAPLNQNQFDALISFQFNTGGLHASTLLTKLNNKDYAGAADQFHRWDFDNKKEVPGLLKRRLAERKLFLTPITAISPVQTIPQPQQKEPSIWARLLQKLKAAF